jgi:XTP/dITP diphosphohydrolase
MGKALLIGSRNRGKAAELSALLEGLGWDVLTLNDFPDVPEPVEDGATFEENAVKKARYFSEQFGVCCVADDSGLVVDALGGEPGVYSARYSGPGATDLTNNEKLLAALKDVPREARTARFVCCAAFVCPGGEPHVEMGTVEGQIAFSPRGPRGFGYDPLFVPEGHERTFAEMDAAEKHSMSHRGKALAKLRTYLESL